MNTTPNPEDAACDTVRITADNLADALRHLGYTFTTTQPLTDQHFPTLLGELHLHTGNIVTHLINLNNPETTHRYATAGHAHPWYTTLTRSIVSSFAIATAIKNDFDDQVANGDTPFNAGAANTANTAFMALGLIAELCRYHADGPSHDRDEIYRLTRELADGLHLIADNHLFDAPASDDT